MWEFQVAKTKENTLNLCHIKWNTKQNQKYRVFFRLQIAILHFNENSDREQATLQDGSERFNIAFPKYKTGEHTVKKILVKCTYGELRMKKSRKLKFEISSFTYLYYMCMVIPHLQFNFSCRVCCWPERERCTNCPRHWNFSFKESWCPPITLIKLGPPWRTGCSQYIKIKIQEVNLFTRILLVLKIYIAI